MNISKRQNQWYKLYLFTTKGSSVGRVKEIIYHDSGRGVLLPNLIEVYISNW